MLHSGKEVFMGRKAMTPSKHNSRGGGGGGGRGRGSLAHSYVTS